MSIGRTLLDVLCTLLPIITFASPATVFLPVLLHSRDDTEERGGVIEMPPLALTTQMLQCFLFGIYAHHFGFWTLFIPNLAGFLLGFLWSTIYPCKIAEDSSGLRWQWRLQYALALCLMTLGMLTVQNTPYLSSTVAAAVGVIMCTYPLPSMSQAYRERNVKLMGSGAMNAAMFTTCVAWVLHSSPLVEYDVFVLVSNAAGVAVQGSALILRVVINTRMGIIEAANEGDDAELSTATPLLRACKVQV